MTFERFTPLDQKNTSVMTLRWTADEHARAVKAAKWCRVSMNEFVKKAVLQAIDLAELAKETNER